MVPCLLYFWMPDLLFFLFIGLSFLYSLYFLLLLVLLFSQCLSPLIITIVQLANRVHWA